MRAFHRFIFDLASIYKHESKWRAIYESHILTSKYSLKLISYFDYVWGHTSQNTDLPWTVTLSPSDNYCVFIHILIQFNVSKSKLRITEI